MNSKYLNFQTFADFLPRGIANDSSRSKVQFFDVLQMYYLSTV